MEEILKTSVFEDEGRALTSSLIIAEVFDKEHYHVMESIRLLISHKEELNDTIFRAVKYKDKKGEMRPMFLMNRDGFSLLVMGFTGEKALDFKLAFIDAFNKMEEELKKRFFATMNEDDEMVMRLEVLLQIKKEQIANKRKMQEMEIKQEILDIKYNALEKRVLNVEQTQNTHDDYYEVKGYAALFKLKLETRVYSSLGKACTKLSNEKNIPVYKAKHPKYGEVNVYHKEVLETIFKAHSLI